jgi:hypothetical protein
MVHFSTSNCTNFHEWKAASLEILLARIIRVHSGYSWFKDIRAGWEQGGAWAVLERGDVWESFSNFREGNLGHAGR